MTACSLSARDLLLEFSSLTVIEPACRQDKRTSFRKLVRKHLQLFYRERRDLINRLLARENPGFKLHSWVEVPLIHLISEGLDGSKHQNGHRRQDDPFRGNLSESPISLLV